MREYEEVSDRPPQPRGDANGGTPRAVPEGTAGNRCSRFDREPNKQKLDDYEAANRATPVAGRWDGV
jgi:hypothetical protein